MTNRILILAAWIRARVSPLAVVVGALLVVCIATAIRAHRTETQLAALQAQYGSAKLVQVADERGKKLGAVLLPQQAGDFWVNQTASSPFKLGQHITFTDGTTPAISGDSSATSISFGTNKAGATLTLAGDANVPFAVFSGASPATTGEIRAPNGIAVVTGRDASNSSDKDLLYWDSSNYLDVGGDAAGASGVSRVNLWAAGGWGLAWEVGGTLTSFAGNMLVGTTGGSSSFTTSLIAGNGQHVIDMTAGTAATTGTTNIIGSLAYTTRTVTASFTVDTTTTDKIIVADTTSGVFTITLPTPTNGRVLTLIDPAGGSGTTGWALHNLTLARHGAEKINGAAASKVLSGQQWTCDVYSNGTDWFTSCS